MLARDIAPGIRLPSEPTPKAFGESVQQVVSQSQTEVNRAFSAELFGVPRILGRCPRLALNAAPLALNRYALASVQKILGSRLRCGALALGARQT